jgi:hypothetical protein
MTTTTTQRTLKSRSLLALAAVFAAVALAGCGSGEEDGAPTSQPETEEAQTPSEQPPTQTDTTRLWIKPDLVECQGEALQQCMQVARAEDGPYELFYDPIFGYDHVVGTAAVVDVMIEEVADPPADGSSLQYTLVSIVE